MCFSIYQVYTNPKWLDCVISHSHLSTRTAPDGGESPMTLLFLKRPEKTTTKHLRIPNLIAQQ